MNIHQTSKKSSRRESSEGFEFADWLDFPAREMLDALYNGLHAQIMAEIMMDMEQKLPIWKEEIKKELLLELQNHGKDEVH